MRMKNITVLVMTVNRAFREWLESCARPQNAVAGFDAPIERLSYVQPGRKFTREEMNER